MHANKISVYYEVVAGINLQSADHNLVEECDHLSFIVKLLLYVNSIMLEQYFAGKIIDSQRRCDKYHGSCTSWACQS